MEDISLNCMNKYSSPLTVYENSERHPLVVPEKISKSDFDDISCRRTSPTDVLRSGDPSSLVISFWRSFKSY